MDPSMRAERLEGSTTIALARKTGGKVDNFRSLKLLEGAQDELLSFQCILGLSAFSGFAKLALEVGCFELLMSKSSHKTQTKRP